MNELDETTLSRKTIYTGPIFRVDTLEVALPNGKTAKRDVVVNPDAAAVVAMPDDGHLLMVRQHRVSAGRTMLEIPAGKLNPGEEPLCAAHRELEEETGYRAATMRILASTRVSPGFSTEVIHLYLAEGLTLGKPNPDEDEFVAVECVPLDDILGMIDRQEIEDGKTIAGVLAATRTLQQRKEGVAHD